MHYKNHTDFNIEITSDMVKLSFLILNEPDKRVEV